MDGPDDKPRARGTRRIAAETTRWCDRGRLEVVDGPAKGSRIDIGTRKVIVGRDEACDLTIADARVSAAHLELVADEDGVVARDLYTTNGTWTGPLRVREVVLGDGSELVVGGSTLRFTYEETPVRLDQKQVERLGRLVGASVPMQALYAQIEGLAPTDLPMLIEGETGTGKEVVARTVHDLSRQASGPFVVVDCGALSPTLLESTLFGHEKGAFSGATEQRVGLLEAADTGTVFLDELGELPLDAQTRLLRFLEAGTIRRVGSTREKKVRVRVVSATHRDIPSMVAAGTFRADLFFRMATARLRVPPLRERREDIARLAQALLIRDGGEPPEIKPEALEVLSRRDYPGNVRELRNVLMVAAAVSRGGAIDAESVRRHPGEHIDLGPSRQPRLPADDAALPDMEFGGALGLYRDEKSRLLDVFEDKYVREVLKRHEGNISHAAAHAGIERHYLRKLMKKHGVPVTRRKKKT